MSDEEEQYEYEEEEVEEVEAPEEAAPPPAKEPEPEPESKGDAEEEEEDDEAPPVSREKKGSETIEAPKLKKAPPPAPKDAEPAEMTEAEAAMLAAKKRHEEEEAAKALESDERRKQELAAVENELVELKQRQAERKEQRAKEEAEFAERRRAEEERRRAEEEERKTTMESEKRRKQEERRNRQLQMAGAFAGVTAYADGELTKNFVLPEKGSGGQQDQQDGLAAPKPGRVSREQQEEAKKNYMSIVNKPIDVSKLGVPDLKLKIKALYSRITKLEGEKYDLEKRKDRQDYDIKELDARRQQEARNKALKMGLSEDEMQIGKHPPKVLVASRFDRVVDRRGYGDKREIFENPYVKPSPSIAHGSGRPPTEWGRKEFDELEQIRKNLEPPKYVEQVKAEGDMAKPPVPIVPMQIPSGEFEEAPKKEEVVEEAPAPPEPPKKGRALKA